MALPEPNILSAISSHLSNLVTNSVSGSPQVRIGPPADAEPKEGDSDPMVNLFLYRIEPSGFYPDITNMDPWYVRIQCMVTAYGSMTPDPGDGDASSISAGEINLRLLGSVLQVFHENPVQDVVFKRANADTAEEEEIRTSLQIVFKPLSTEEINQIWATQGDVAYRSSVAYELALAPITPTARRASPAPVGSVDLSSGPMPSKKISTPHPGSGANGAARLNMVADPERALIEEGKANLSELAPELSITNPPRGARISVRGWEEVPEGGHVPSFKTELDTVELTFTPYAGLTDHFLFVFERQGPSWRQAEKSAVAPLAPGETSKVVTFAVPKQQGEWMIYVESRLAGADGEKTIVRANVVSLSVVVVSEPVNGGGP